MPRQSCETEGILRLPGLFPAADVAAMRASLWDTLLEPAGLRRDDPSTWRAGGPLALTDILGALRPGPGTHDVLTAAGQSDVFAIVEPILRRALGDLFTEPAWAPLPGSRGGLAAPGFPLPGARWTVPHRAWHADEPTSADHPAAWGLLAFLFLDGVASRSGGTMVLAGSARRLHQLARDRGAHTVLATEQSLAALSEAEPWIADLLTGSGGPDERARRFMEQPCISAGIPLRVVELTGEPGDVTLMDPRCLHTVSPNPGPRPRLTMRITCGRA